MGNGCDVFDCVATYVYQWQQGIGVLSGSGMETNVSIKQPGPVGAFMTRHERFEILSLFGSFLQPLVPPGATGLTIFLVGGHGQVVGGSVVVELTAARLVIVNITLFTDVVYKRLLLDEEQSL